MKMSSLRSIIAIFGIALSCCAHAAQDTTSNVVDDDTLVGINYFAGWWEDLPNKWQGGGWNADAPDWRKEFPDRVPLLGQYNVQATMDREIAAAAKHGVDFFAILWYFPQPGSRQEKTAPLLNKGLETYLASPNAKRMSFFIEYCNAPNFSARDEEEWNACVKVWVIAMKHPSYLRIDGRLIFKVHGVTQFLKTNDNDLTLCRKRLDALRMAVREAGLGEMIIGVGVSAETPPLGPRWPPAELFDFTSTYMCVPKTEASKEEQSYAILAKQAQTARAGRASTRSWWRGSATSAVRIRSAASPSTGSAVRPISTVIIYHESYKLNRT